MTHPATADFDPSTLSETERRILTSLARAGERTKKQLSQECNVGWATIVKMIDRLRERGLVTKGGTSADAPDRGKNAYVFMLGEHGPLAIGIDVEYRSTKFVVNDLSDTVLARAEYPTPIKPTVDELVGFLSAGIRAILDERPDIEARLQGIGVGLPSWILQQHPNGFTLVADMLRESTGLPTRVQNNVRNFTLYQKWRGPAFARSDFAVVTIRNGVGACIYLADRIVSGANGMAGEIGHVPIEKDGKLCSCGKRGCLETVANQRTLYADYVQTVRGGTVEPEAFSDQRRIRDSLSELFRLVKRGEPAATQVVTRFADVLGRGVATLLMVVDVPIVYVAGDFGADGDALLPLLASAIEKELPGSFDFEPAYLPLKNDGFPLGASHLVLAEYYSPWSPRRADAGDA